MRTSMVGLSRCYVKLGIKRGQCVIKDYKAQPIPSCANTVHRKARYLSPWTSISPTYFTIRRQAPRA